MARIKIELSSELIFSTLQGLIHPTLNVRRIIDNVLLNSEIVISQIYCLYLVT